MTTIVVASVFSAGAMGVGIARCLGSWSGRGRRFCKRGVFDQRRPQNREREHEHDWGSLVGEGTVEPVERETVSRAVGGARINFFVSSYNRIFSVHFADPAPQITDQLIERFVFRFSRQVSIEIPDQADADGDIVKIIAVNVSAVQLPDPTVADLDLTVP